MTGRSLTERAHGAAPDIADQAGPPTLPDQIRAMEAEFSKAMPKGMEAAQLVRDALTCIRAVPKLAECPPQSVLGALMSCAQLGLRPGVLGQAWVLPYYDRRSRGQKAQLVIGYKGYVELAYRSPQVESIIGRTVYEGDTFDVEYGLDDSLVHRPLMTGDRSQAKPVAYYAIVKFAGGGRVFWVMSEDEMQAWMEKYAPRNRDQKIVGPWVSDYEAMARKTTLLRLAAWMPKATEMAYAMEIDNGVRTNTDPAAQVTEVTHIYRDGDPDAPDPADVVPGDVVPPEDPQ